ncbi:MAG: hypothetical protein Q4B17_00380 [Lautropia sp.]|nr:hypothetical protein [Lautropia sp.]
MNAVPAQYIALHHLKQHWAEARHVDEQNLSAPPRRRRLLSRWFYLGRRT